MGTAEILRAEPEFNPRYMDAMAEVADREIEWHLEHRKDWSYHDILTREVVARLASAPPVEVDRYTQLVYLGNLIVEEGIPEYDRLTSHVYEQHPVFRRWKNIWVAQEKFHGQALVEWAKVSGFLDMAQVHRNVSGYLQNGLSLDFDDAAFASAYPATQEPATKITHKSAKDLLPDDQKEGGLIFSKVIGDEHFHHIFYDNLVSEALHSDDREVASFQMRGAARAVLGFFMPGIEHDIPDRIRITVAYKKTGAFTLGMVAREVLLPAIEGKQVTAKTKQGWQVADVVNLDDRAKIAQERLVKFGDDIRAAGDDDDALTQILYSARLEVLEAA